MQTTITATRNWFTIWTVQFLTKEAFVPPLWGKWNTKIWHRSLQGSNSTVKPEIIGSLSNHDNKNPSNLHFLTMKNSIFARFARAFFIFWHFADVLVLSTTWNDLFCSCVDDVGIWWQMFNFVFLCSKRWFQFNSRIVRTHFSSIMTLINWKMIAETRSYIFRWRSRFRRRGVCLIKLPNEADISSVSLSSEQRAKSKNALAKG